MSLGVRTEQDTPDVESDDVFVCMWSHPMKPRFVVLVAMLGGMAFLPLMVPVLEAADTRLADAAEQRDHEVVRALLEQNVDVNAPQAHGATALAWAAHWDDLEIVDLLIGARADVNASNDLNVTPLMQAATNGSAAMAAKLLAAGADPNVTRSSGETALFLAARTGAAPVVKLLLAHGGNPNTKVEGGATVLMFAAFGGHGEATRLLVDAGADVNARADVIAGGDGPTTQQPRGTDKAKLQLFENQAIHPGMLRLEGDGEPPRAEGGYTPLLYAALGGNVECVKAIAAGGSKIDEPAADGMTALTLAVLRFREAAALYLIDQGANVNNSTVGYTPLHLAALTGQMAVTKALVEHDAEVNARLQYPGRLLQSYYSYKPELMFGRTNHIGATPFVLAAKGVNVEVLAYLVEHGADPRLETKSQTTAMQLTAGIGKRQQSDFYPHVRWYTWNEEKAIAAISFLLSLGLDVNEANEFGETALHGAAGHSALRVIEFLVEQGADVNATNWAEQTPLRIAEGHIYSDTFVRHREASALLLTLGADQDVGTQLGFSITGYVDDNLKEERRPDAAKETK